MNINVENLLKTCALLAENYHVTKPITKKQNKNKTELLSN